ncbi:hypothetical protein C2S51_021443 [Perilla frutescens var. frutescens]|nr:hypothetical protein C2S51_021443 [Perilla frutescens var. frutescens]
MKKLKSGQTVDRLSELPDALILKIISSLDMRDVVGTTLLSKRWNNLWTTIPCLCYVNYDISRDNEEEIRNFISQALLLWKGSRVQKFKIHFCGDIDESFYRDMNWWLGFVTEKKVEELYLCLVCDDGLINLPHFLYECSSIRKLSLVECGLHICGDVHWDQLKSLTIECYSVPEDVINRLLVGAPQLEIFELSINASSNGSFTIRSRSLKKLSIKKNLYWIREFDQSWDAMLTIWTPNLETLVISGAAYGKCLLMDVSSLTDMTLDFDDLWVMVPGETLRQFLPTFQRVEKLTLSSRCFEMLGFMKGKYSFSPFSNVKLLRVTCDLIKSNQIVGLLEIFPQLKMLDICQRRTIHSAMNPGEPFNSEVDTIKSLMMQLRIVEIGWYKYEKSIFEFIEFFLEHATMIEKMLIQNRGGTNVELDDMILAAEKLLSLQKSFPTVELIFCRK